MDEEALHRAKTYPYPIPTRSYLFSRGRLLDLPSSELDLEGRTPVLAVGSNQSPEQLARKFVDDNAADGGWGDIPVVRIALRDFDSVYSPHIATYGAIAATLQEAPGVTVSLFVTWLDDRQLPRMHETEISSANYGFARLNGLKIETEAGPPLEALYMYVSTRGTLCQDGQPIPVREIPAVGRTWSSMNQQEVQRHVRDRLAPGRPLNEFIAESVNDSALRRERSDTLREGARPFAPTDLERIPI